MDSYLKYLIKPAAKWFHPVEYREKQSDVFSERENVNETFCEPIDFLLLL